MLAIFITTDSNTTNFSVRLLFLFNPHDTNEFHFSEERKCSESDEAYISPVNYNRFVVAEEIMKQVSPAIWSDRNKGPRKADTLSNRNMLPESPKVV